MTTTKVVIIAVITFMALNLVAPLLMVRIPPVRKA